LDIATDGDRIAKGLGIKSGAELQAEGKIKVFSE
jgi:hypothetical protein